jgi:hypothetical protein
MKKQIFLLLVAVGLYTTSFAQLGPVSLGLELAKPTGDFGDAYPLGFGLSAGYEHPVGEKLGITVQVGYVLLTVDDDISDFIDKASMMPLQAGLKYYVSEFGSGLYIHGQIGVHSVSVTTKDFSLLGVTVEGETDSETSLSFAIGLGFMATEKLDIGLRYNIITPPSDAPDDADASSYIGLRLAYTLFGGV